MREDQQSFQVQLGKSIVAMHKEHQSKINALEQKLSSQINTTSDNNVVATTSVNNRPIYVTQQPTIPTFSGVTSQKHPVKFLEEVEVYLSKLNVPLTKRLDIIREALVDEAREWANIFQISWETYEDFRNDFLHAFWSEEEQNKLRTSITTHRWNAAQRRTMESHFAHYVGRARLLTNPIPENLLVGELMKHFPATLQSLWALKPEAEKTVAKAAEFLRSQENIINQVTGGQVAIRNLLPPNKRFRLDNRNYSGQPNHQDTSGNGRRSN